MIRALKKNTLVESVGTYIRNTRGESLGEIMEITHNKKSDHAEYIILKSSEFFGRGERFFAIPASSEFITVNDSGQLTFSLSQDDLQFAEGISAEKCPMPDYKLGNSIYELYQYRHPLEEIKPQSASKKNRVLGN